MTNQKIVTFPEPDTVDTYMVGTGKQIVLTFDDGPSAYTEQILDILKKYNVPATFFVIGGNIQKYPGVVKRIAREGHTIGNSTFSHDDLFLLDAEKVRDEIKLTQKAVEALTHRSTLLFRQPYDLNNVSDAESL